MKIKNLIPTILLIAVFMPGNSIFISCKPSNEIVPDTIPSNLIYYDTIKPKDYLPVYPGSWWKYQINDKEFIIDSVSMNYKLNSYLTFGNYNEYYYTDSVYVPFLNSNPIYGYYKIEYMYQNSYYKKWPILSEKVGTEFQRDFVDNRHGDCGETIKVVQKTKINNDSIIILKGHWGICDINYMEKTMRVSTQVYKKYIGLTSYYIVDTTKQDTLYKKILVDYFINK